MKSEGRRQERTCPSAVSLASGMPTRSAEDLVLMGREFIGGGAEVDCGDPAYHYMCSI
jgi:hypothetical protein